MEYRGHKCCSRVEEKAFGSPNFRKPNDRDPYTLTTDASLTGIGAIVTQKQGTEDIIIANASKTLSKIQRNYSTTKRKLFAIVHFSRYVKKYFEEPDGMVARWIEKLGQFNFDIKHRAGKKIPHADCLSRINTEDEEQTAFVNTIALDVEQGDDDYSSPG